MLIVKTPFRMSFVGGGTDVANYYEKYGGAVLSTTFDKYCYHTIRYYPPFFKHIGRATYSQIEEFDSPDEIKHPIIREVLRKFGVSNIHVMYDADLPARSGLGTSSAFSVGLLNGIHSLRGEFIDKMSLAKEAIYLERVLCKEAGGVQDQLACSFGGLNKISFSADGFDVTPVIMPVARKQLLSDSLMLFFTGFVRFSSKIMAEQISNTSKKLEQLHQMVKLVDEGLEILTRGTELNEFGRLLDYTWKLKRSLAGGISNDTLDEIYSTAQKAGAIGGKVLGAGGGGFILFFVEPEKQPNILQALKNLRHVPFEFETGGTKVIYYKDETESGGKIQWQ
ncbi:MAG: kinase [Selenomonadaceae bacterium]|nr:kinase [Selenomonadaceae bacterium]